MCPDQLLQLDFLLELRASAGLLVSWFAGASLPSCRPLVIGISIVDGLPAGRIFPHESRDVVRLLLVIPSLVARVVHAQNPPQHGGTSQIIDREIRAALILVLEECKPPALPGVLVADEVDVNRLAVLREDREDVALGQVER